MLGDPLAHADVAGGCVEIRDDSVHVKGVCDGNVPKGVRLTYLGDPGMRMRLVDNESALRCTRKDYHDTE
jgi:hypothetical protein